MKTIIRSILAAVSIAAAYVMDAIGGADKLAVVLVAAIAIDYASGVACAAIWHRSPKSDSGALESRAGLKGLFRKGGIFLCCWLAAELSQLLNTAAIRDSTIIFFICNETLSIIENLGIMGVPFPPAIKSALDALQDKTEKKDPDNEK